MSAAVRFHRLAECELSEAAEYYDSESPGLGRALLAEAERTIAAIVIQPEIGQLVGGGIRRRLFHRFPYGVIYLADESMISVLAIMNLSRRPNYWVDRI